MLHEYDPKNVTNPVRHEIPTDDDTNAPQPPVYTQDDLDHAATQMRTACVEKVRSVAQVHREMAEKLKGKVIGEIQSIRAEECEILAESLSSLTLDQVKQK